MKRKIIIALVTLIAGLSVLAVLPFVPCLLWYTGPRFRAYRALYRDINVGMTKQEVYSLIQKHYPPEGGRSRPKIWEDTDSRLCMFMNPEDHTEPNCEGIFLTMASNAVVRKKYSMD